MQTRLAWVILLLVGCGPTAGPKDGQTFRTAYFTAVSEKWSQCDGTPVDGLQYLFNGDYQGDLVRRSVSAERVLFNAEQADACLEAIQTASCEQFASVAVSDERCLKSFVGLVGEGDLCFSEFDCEPDTFCNAQSGSRCFGACQKQTALSGACLSAFECPQTADCVVGRCVELASEGSSCLGQLFPACAAGLFCDRETTADPGICTARKLEGACIPSVAMCQFPSQCLPADESLEFFECQLPKREGEACTGGLYECGAPSPANFLTCRNDVCTRLPVEGEPCGAVDIESVGCFRSWCGVSQANATIGACQPLLALGEPCLKSQECSEGVCDNLDQECVAQCLPPETKSE